MTAPLITRADIARACVDRRMPGILQVARDCWGIESLRPLQREAIEAEICGRDSLVVMPTGGGKSLCYQAPAVAREGGLTVVVSPLIALMRDQVASLEGRGLPAAYVASDMHPNDRAEVMRKAKAREIYLLYLSPERITDPACLADLAGCRGMTLIIDEAHCISTWGHDFRPAYRKLGGLRKLFPSTAIHAFTATATPQVVTEIIEQLCLRDPVVLIGDFDRPNLHLSVERRDHLDRRLLDWIRARPGKSGIVYCSTRAETEQLAEMLRLADISARTYHAGMDGDQRAEAQSWFCLPARETYRGKIIVATIAFGMGIDKPDVRWIVHTAMPSSMEVHHQEIGRAGRDGEPAECVVFYHPGDFSMWESRIHADESIPPEHVSERIRHLLAMRRFCHCLRLCRHTAIRQYFGQAVDSDHNCNACDFCDSQPKQSRDHEGAGSKETQQ